LLLVSSFLLPSSVDNLGSSQTKVFMKLLKDWEKFVKIEKSWYVVLTAYQMFS